MELLVLTAYLLKTTYSIDVEGKLLKTTAQT